MSGGMVADASCPRWAQPVPELGLADRQTANLTLTLGEAAQSGEPGAGLARGSRPWT